MLFCDIPHFQSDAQQFYFEYLIEMYRKIFTIAFIVSLLFTSSIQESGQPKRGLLFLSSDDDVVYMSRAGSKGNRLLSVPVHTQRNTVLAELPQSIREAMVNKREAGYADLLAQASGVAEQ